MQRELCYMKFKKRLRFRSPLNTDSGTVQPLPARAYGVVLLSAPLLTVSCSIPWLLHISIPISVFLFTQALKPAIAMIARIDNAPPATSS